MAKIQGNQKKNEIKEIINIHWYSFTVSDMHVSPHELNN